MKKIFIGLLMLLSGTVYADGHTRVDLTVASHHFNRSYDWNEVNPGVIVRFNPMDNNSFFITGGAFKNSYGDLSTLIGVGNEIQVGKYFDLGYNAGFVTGYHSRFHMAALPMITPYITIANKVTFTYQIAGRKSSIGLSVRAAEW